MKHSLQLRLSQHLTLTPQLQQSIRLLQLSTLELTQELERVLQENPLLERDEGTRDQPLALPPGSAPATESGAAGDSPTPEGEGESESASAEIEVADYNAGDDATPAGYRDESEDGEYQQAAADSPTLRAHLLAQLSLTKLSERDRRLVILLIDSLDEGGYLTQSLEEFSEILPAELEVEAEELQIALKHLQNLEPAGIGARNLSECLALQLAVLP